MGGCSILVPREGNFAEVSELEWFFVMVELFVVEEFCVSQSSWFVTRTLCHSTIRPLGSLPVCRLFSTSSDSISTMATSFCPVTAT